MNLSFQGEQLDIFTSTIKSKTLKRKYICGTHTESIFILRISCFRKFFVENKLKAIQSVIKDTTLLTYLKYQFNTYFAEDFSNSEWIWSPFQWVFPKNLLQFHLSEKLTEF